MRKGGPVHLLGRASDNRIARGMSAAVVHYETQRLCHFCLLNKILQKGYYVDPEKLNRRLAGRRRGGKKVTEREGGKP